MYSISGGVVQSRPKHALIGIRIREKRKMATCSAPRSAKTTLNRECLTLDHPTPHPVTPTTLNILTLPLMSHTHPSTSSNFQIILDNALKAYKKRTKNDLLKHPLADRLQACNSPSSMLTVLQEQVQELNQSQRSNTKWLDPTVNVLHTFSEVLGEGVGSVGFRT